MVYALLFLAPLLGGVLLWSFASLARWLRARREVDRVARVWGLTRRRGEADASLLLRVRFSRTLVPVGTRGHVARVAAEAAGCELGGVSVTDGCGVVEVELPKGTRGADVARAARALKRYAIPVGVAASVAAGRG